MQQNYSLLRYLLDKVGSKQDASFGFARKATKFPQSSFSLYVCRSLLPYLKNLSYFNNLTGQAVSFDDDGNPRSSHYTAAIMEVGNGEHKEVEIGNWSCSQHPINCTGGLLQDTVRSFINATAFRSNCGPTCDRGHYKSVHEEHPDCCWTCRKCAGNKYANTSGQLSCSQCPDDQWPDANHTSCAEIEHDHLNVLSVSGVLILAWNVAAFVLILFVTGVFLKYNSSHIVKASSRQLSMLLLLGISITLGMVMTLLQEPSAGQCFSTFVIGHAANCLVTGTLFLKTNRIHRIFRKSAMKGTPG